jgi:hypothetical protein
VAQSGQRKCLCCGLFFDLDHRNRKRQRYCSATACRRASKAASQASWLAQPRTASTAAALCTSLASGRGALLILVLGAAGSARGVRYKIP